MRGVVPSHLQRDLRHFLDRWKAGVSCTDLDTRAMELAARGLRGKILAHLALNKKHELLELAMVRKKPFPYPPEPLRALAVNAVTRSLRRMDSGEEPGLILRILDRMGIGFSS